MIFQKQKKKKKIFANDFLKTTLETLNEEDFKKSSNQFQKREWFV
jgi:hypothetical protein